MNKKYFRSAILGVIFLLASVFSISSHTLAEGAPFYWNYINVDLDVQQNGDMLVTEIQQYNFTANHNNQRYRYIPLNKLNKISDVTVEENNQIIPSETGVENSQFWIRWQHPLKSPAIHTFTLKYFHCYCTFANGCARTLLGESRFISHESQPTVFDYGLG